MRIAYLVHFYPPSACGGAGNHTASLAETFQKGGAEVGVLCVDRWGQGDRYLNGQDDEVRNAVFVRRLHVNWQKAPRPFDWLYDSPMLGAQARLFLTEFRPDVVHVASCYTLSARPIFVAKEMGLPMIVHLHDYWLICARHTLLHKNDTQCSGPESDWKCQACLLADTKIWKGTSHVFQKVTQQRLLEALGSHSWATRLPGCQGLLGNLAERRRTMLRAAAAADALVTPTAFARRQHMQYGIHNPNFVVLSNGHEIAWSQKVSRQPSDLLRIGFLGNVMPIKGVHLLIEAYRRLIANGHANQIELQIWGDASLAPEYHRNLWQFGPEGVKWGGRYEKTDLPRILSNIDIVVVPSLWYEVQPLVIQEAFAAGVPVIVSDNTSMAEAVIPEHNGLHFRRGDVEDLARQLGRLLSDVNLLNTLRRGVPSVRGIEQNVEELTRLYAQLIRSRTIWPTNSTQEEHPIVAIVVLTWNQRDLTLACLNPLAQISHSDDKPCIIVVDNGSTDDTATAVRRYFPEVVVLETGTNLGYAGGNNAGIRHALALGADVVCILNNDVIVEPDFLKPLLAALSSEPNAGIVTPLIAEQTANSGRVWALGSTVDWYTAAVSRQYAGEPVDTLRRNPPFDVEIASGATMLIKREVFEQVGLMDEDFFLYFEEVDWCLRVRQGGYRILAVPASVVWHKISATLGTTSPVIDYYMLRNHLRLIGRHWQGRTRVYLQMRIVFLNMLTIAAYTAKPHGGRRIPNRNARLMALRDAMLGRWGKMGPDVARICYPNR